MKKSRMVLTLAGAFFLFLMVLTGCAQVPQYLKGEPPRYTGLGEYENPNQGFVSIPLKKEAANPNAPVIKAAYAIDRGRFGTALRVYLEAEDPNGDMAKIVTTVDQVAYGRYPADFIILKPGHEKYFKGYIQWNTWSSHTTGLPEGNYVSVGVSVVDKADNSSNHFYFPFTFETGVTGEPQPPAPFGEANLPKLGNVSVDLYNPYSMGDGDMKD